MAELVCLAAYPAGRSGSACRCGRRDPAVQNAGGAPGRMAIRADADSVRALLRGAGRFDLPLYRARRDHDLSGGRPRNQPEIHPCGRVDPDPDHSGLYGLCLLGVPRQD